METYEAPKMEIIEFDVEDVITTSGEDDGEHIGMENPPLQG